MSGRREKERRRIFGVDLKYERRYKKWLREEPPFYRFRKWRKWRAEEPKRTW